MDPDLPELVERLRSSSQSERIHLREPILAHGPAALTVLVKLTAERPDLGPSIAAWTEAFAHRDGASRGPGVAALRQLAGMPDGPTARYADRGLERLGATPHQKTKVGGSIVAVSGRAGTEWPGFQEHEFGRNQGTRWRSSNGPASLAPILLRALRTFDPGFVSFGVERSPEVHFALARRYKGEEGSGFTASKLVVYAHGPTDERPTAFPQVVVGYYVERDDGMNYGPTDNARRWDWPLFLAALARPPFQTALTDVMLRDELAFGDYAEGRFSPTIGWVARIEGGEPVARDQARQVVATGWDQVTARLQALPPSPGVDLHIWRSWPAADAVAAGQPFAMRTLMPVLEDLARLYLKLF